MLLRRITEHVKAQNWTAVGLDFVIVVVGVLMAFQITEWNAVRAAGAEEKRILAQLKQEVAGAIEIRQPWLEQQRATIELLGETILLIQSTDPSVTLEPHHCASAAYSHAITWTDAPLVTADELVSAGRINLLRDANLRNAILTFQALRESGLQELWYWLGRNYSLTDEHADAFPAKLNNVTFATYELGDSEISCDVDIIRRNPTISNKIINNRFRTIGVVEWAEQELQRLEELATLLENAHK